MSVDISERIFVLRGQRVLLDVDLAMLYGVETRRLNEQVRRNRHRFPSDFVFEINQIERANLMSQFATSSWGGHRKPPVAFTEHGAIMAATVLNSPRAVEMSVYVVRAFVKLREVRGGLPRDPGTNGADRAEVAADRIYGRSHLGSVSHDCMTHRPDRERLELRHRRFLEAGR